MPHTEEQIEELIREMYTTGDSADWEIDPEKIRSQRARLRMPVPDVKVLVLVAAAVILIVVGIVVANGSPSRRSAASLPTTTLSDPNSVEAPNLVGLTQVQAGTVLGRAGLNLGTISAAPSSLYAAGLVISQTPPAGSSVSPGGSVDLTMSTGLAGATTTTRPGTVIVPSLIGLAQVQAGTDLGQAGLTVGNVSSSPSNNFAPGMVISQAPAPGSSVMPGSSVEIVVSTGPTSSR